VNPAQDALSETSPRIQIIRPHDEYLSLTGSCHDACELAFGRTDGHLKNFTDRERSTTSANFIAVSLVVCSQRGNQFPARWKMSHKEIRESETTSDLPGWRFPAQ
jgi:hypothetical protein